MHVHIFILFGLFFLIPFSDAYASNEIFITISEGMEEVTFDGKWTNSNEWKPSSRDTLYYDGMTVQLRTAHQNNFVYVMIDPINDNTYDKKLDKATVCFNSDTNSTKFNDKVFCFTASPELKSNTMLQGNSNSNTLEETNSPSDYIGISTISDERDRYSKIPHTTYEFKIPTDLIGRFSTYDFFVSVYDASSNINYNWPQNIILEDPNEIPTPEQWGKIISPDKSLPEFHSMFIVISFSIFVTIFFTRIKKLSYN